VGSVDWPSLLLGGAISLVASLVVAAVFYWLATRGLEREAADLRRLNLLLIYLLDGAGVIDVKEYDQETGEPKRWSVSKTVELVWRTQASEATEPREEPDKDPAKPERVEPEQVDPEREAPERAEPR